MPPASQTPRPSSKGPRRRGNRRNYSGSPEEVEIKIHGKVTENLTPDTNVSQTPVDGTNPAGEQYSQSQTAPGAQTSQSDSQPTTASESPQSENLPTQSSPTSTSTTPDLSPGINTQTGSNNIPNPASLPANEPASQESTEVGEPASQSETEKTDEPDRADTETGDGGQRYEPEENTYDNEHENRLPEEAAGAAALGTAQPKSWRDYLPKRNKKDKPSPDRNELAKNEKGAGKAGNQKAGANHGEKPGRSLYKPKSSASDDPGRLARLRALATRRKIAFGAIGGGGIIGLIFTFFVVQGPAQVVQLSKVLQNPSSKISSDSSNRLSKAYRFAKTGNIGETRLSTLDVLGRKVFGDPLQQLEKIGINIELNPNTNAPTRTSYDINKLKSAYPELAGMSDSEAKAFLADKIGVSPDQILGSKGNFFVDETGYNLNTIKQFTKSNVGLLGDGKIVGGLKARVLNKFFGVPSLFHPISKILADKLNGLTAAAKQKALEQQEQAKESSITDGVEAEGETAVDKVKSEDIARGGITGALTFTGGACIVYSTAGEIVKVNRDLVVLPAALMAVNFIAAGSQVMSGQDLTAAQVGVLLASLNGPGGKSIWDGEALQALSNGGIGRSGLTDLPSNYKTAFSGTATAASIQHAADESINKVTGLHAGGTFGACGKIGTAAQILASLAFTVKDTFEEVISGGALTPEVAAELAAYAAAKETVSAGETMILLHYIQSFVLGKTTVKLAADAFRGPVGGDLLAYGARAAANITAIASGGIALGNNASTQLSYNQQVQSEKQFQSMSIVKRLFDPYDYRSAIARLIDASGTSPLQTISKIGSMFANFGSLISHSLSALTPHALAVDQSYNWGFSQYGIPDSLLNDPQLADPYANAQYVVDNILTPGAPNANDPEGMSYIQKAYDCFGIDINNNNPSNSWDAVPATEVNPSDVSYTNANCNDSDENWHRVIMFVFDTTTLKAAACYEGDEQSCQDIGMGISTSSSSSSASSGSTANCNDIGVSVSGINYKGTISYSSSVTGTNSCAQHIAQCNLFDSSDKALAQLNNGSGSVSSYPTATKIVCQTDGYPTDSNGIATANLTIAQ